MGDLKKNKFHLPKPPTQCTSSLLFGAIRFARFPLNPNPGTAFGILRPLPLFGTRQQLPRMLIPCMLYAIAKLPRSTFPNNRLNLRSLALLRLHVLVSKVAGEATDENESVESNTHASAVVAVGSSSFGSGSGLGGRVASLSWEDELVNVVV